MKFGFIGFMKAKVKEAGLSLAYIVNDNDLMRIKQELT